MAEPLLLGVDGGNTKTIALLARADGTVVGAGRAFGCADIHQTQLDDALAVIRSAVAAALVAAGVAPAPPTTPIGDDSPICASAFSLAGADWPEDLELLAGRLDHWASGPVVVNDAIGALRAAIPRGPGVVVVCGTGAATGARGADGQTWHSSFWQEPQGARELGEHALRAVLRAELGIDPPTRLTAGVLDALGAPDVETLLHRRTRRDRESNRDAAVLAPLVLDTAEAGDPTAAAIVRGQGVALGQTAIAAARRVGVADAPFALALAGGVFRHPGRLMHDMVLDTARAGSPGVHEVRPRLEPAAGALLLAFDAAGMPVDAAVDTRLHATLPEAALYDTHPASVTGTDARSA